MKKNQYRLFLLDFSQQPKYLNELNVHYNFNPSTKVTGIQRFDMPLNYIMMLGEPLGTDRLRNIAIGDIINRDNAQNSLECINFGDHQYKNCVVGSRQDKKAVSIQVFVSCNKCYLKPKVVQHRKARQTASVVGPTRT